MLPIRPGCTGSASQEELEAVSRREVARVTNITARRQRRLEREIGRPAIPTRYQHQGFDCYQAAGGRQSEIKRVVENYAANFADSLATGRWLALCGSCGTGKTHLACAAIHSVIANGFCGAHLTLMELVTAVRDTWRRDSVRSTEQVLQAWLEPDLLVIDEIGAGRSDRAQIQLLLDLLERRYSALRPTMLLANLTPRQLEECLGEAVIDRVHENGGAVLACSWPSWRRRHA